MFGNSWFKKEKPFLSMIGLGGGATSLDKHGGASWEPSGITATGGTMHTGQANPDGTPYTWHVFPGGPRGPESPVPYSFSVSAVTGPGKIEYIVMGGGGLGGVSPNPDPGQGSAYGGAGGGGAGGVICNFESPPLQETKTYHPFYPVSPGAMTVSATSYAIEVGRGAGGNPAPERNGKDSTFNGLTAKGGGAGARSGNPSGLVAQPGGSGGGGSANDTAGAGPNSPTQGNSGGNGAPGDHLSGGGGGGGGAGGAGSSPPPASGGVGIMFDDDSFFKLSVGGITDNPAQPGYRYLAGGGGGGGTSDNTGNPPGTGGFGGGGDSGNPGNNPGNGGSADNWSGGGGGGAGGGTNTMPGGLGGQGMVFIRYVAD